jgi:5-carboxymethyl-2-hydroxymuconic-semialdehyde dehydrogenase
MSDLQKNLARAEDYLARFARDGVLNHIGGVSVAADSGETFETRSPADGRLLAKVAKGGASDIDKAAKAAKAAFKSWAALSGADRRKICCTRSPTPSLRAQRKSPSPNAWTPASRCVSCPRQRCAERKTSASMPTRPRRPATANQSQAPGQVNMTTRHPIGPVGVITPWNTPFMLSTWKIAPALAAGCTVVHKPAEFSPLTARLLVEIAEEAGLPKGVWNLVNGFGEDAGKALTDAPGHQGHRLCRRKPHRLDDHAPGRRDAEARAFRTRRQEPGRRLRRCRPRARCGCRCLHDLFAEWRALHLLVPPAGRGEHP